MTSNEEVRRGPPSWGWRYPVGRLLLLGCSLVTPHHPINIHFEGLQGQWNAMLLNIPTVW